MLAATDEGNEIIETKVNSPSLEYHAHVLTGSVPEDANELKAATEALEEEKARPYYTAENPDDPVDLHMHNTNQTLARQRPIETVPDPTRSVCLPTAENSEGSGSLSTRPNHPSLHARPVSSAEIWGLLPRCV